MYNGELKTVGVVPGTNTILTGSGNMSGSGSPLGSSMTSSSSGEPSPLNTDPNAQLGPGLEGGSPGEDEVRAYYFRSLSSSGPLVLPVLFSTPSTISQKMASIYMIQALIEDTVSKPAFRETFFNIDILLVQQESILIKKHNSWRIFI